MDELDEAELRTVRSLLTVLDNIDPWLDVVFSEQPSGAPRA
ncbi:hypothetical protein ACQPZJ_03120 [Actinoplanes sp. CA-054009]